MINFYDRTAYRVFILQIPHVRGRELLSAVKIKLAALYPGDVADCNIQILKNSGRKWSYLVFLLDKDTGKRMLSLSTLFVQYLNAQKTANVLFAGKNWLEYIRMENGALISSTVKTRNEEISLEDVRSLCGADNDYTIYCDEEDRIFFTPLQEEGNIDFFDPGRAMQKTDVHKVSLFSGKSPVKKWQRFACAALSMLFLAIFSSLLYQHRRHENQRISYMRLEQERERLALAERRREDLRLTELRQRYIEIMEGKTASPFDISLVIAEASQPRTRIRAATFNGNFFQLEGLTNNSIALLESFENHSLISEVRLHQVHPSSPLDTFTLSGTVRRQIAYIDESLPPSEQIMLLENLIALETNSALYHAAPAPSAFASAANSLFARRGVSVATYRFLNEPQHTEMEFSLRGSGSAFFSALHEMQSQYPLWEIPLTQIRNLYPQNMLEILVRLRVPRYEGNNGSVLVTHLSPPANPSPVASISRNYFIPAPFTPQAQPLPVIEPLPPVQTQPVQRAVWLTYVGSLREDEEIRHVYFRNTRTGALLRLSNKSEGNMRYVITQAGAMLAHIDGNVYEVSRW